MNFKKGYTLLFAVLLTSVILSISVSIMTIARKEVMLSSNARESFSAVYIADGAIDCAIYHIRFANSFNSKTNNPKEQIDCGNLIGISVEYVNNTTYDRYTFYVYDQAAVDYAPCAKVTVDKYVAVPQRVVIESRGYNIGYNSSNNTCSMSHPRKVERAFRYSYTM